MKRLHSIFTDNMDKCIVTGIEATSDNRNGIEIHHIFGGTDRKKSEWYQFCVPLHCSVHPNGSRLTDSNWMELDHWLKRMCQEYFIANLGSREDWYRLFGRFYDDRDDEKTWLNGGFKW